MRTVVQRVREASVSVNGSVCGSIARGLLVYLGVERGDTESEVEYLVRKTLSLRVFDDASGQMNLSIVDRHATDAEYGVLVISQFTLLGDTRKGNRPSYNRAEHPERARSLYEHFATLLDGSGLPVATGAFGEEMDVWYHNDGPVTILMDTNERRAVR